MHFDIKNKKHILALIVVLLFSFNYIKNNVLPRYSWVGHWTSGPSMNKPIFLGSAIELKDGNILVIGGKTAEIYLTKKHKFVKTNKPIIDREYGPLMMLMQDGKVVIYNGTSTKVNEKTVEVYDPDTQQYKIIGDTILKHYEPSVTFQNKIFNYDIDDNEYMFEIFDPSTSKSKMCTIKKSSCDKDFTMSNPAMTEANGKIIISGGVLRDRKSPGGINWAIGGLISELSPDTCTLKTIGKLKVPRGGHSSILLPDGNILIVGGCDDTGKNLLGREIFEKNINDKFHFGYYMHQGYMREIELINPKTGESKVVGKLNYGIGPGPQLNILKNRYILVIGKGKQAEIIDTKDFKLYPAGRPTRESIGRANAKIGDDKAIAMGQSDWVRSIVNIFHLTKKD